MSRPPRSERDISFIIHITFRFFTAVGSSAKAIVGGGTSFSMLQTMNEAHKVARLTGHRLRHCITAQLTGWHERGIPPPRALERDLHFICRRKLSGVREPW